MYLKYAIFSFLLFFTTTNSFAQTDPLAVFQNLIGTWVFEGKQLGVDDGKTEMTFKLGLGGKIIKVQTYTTDPATKVYGLRNEGIRAYSAPDSSVVFYEFDKYGGITSGKALIDGNNIHYEYEYQGLSLRDTWQYVDKSTYQLTVGVWTGEAWKAKYHEATYRRKE